MLKPPSMAIDCPVINADSSETKKTAKSPTSELFAILPSGWLAPHSAKTSSTLLSPRCICAEVRSIGVSTDPGKIAFTRTLLIAKSIADALVNAFIAPLEAAYATTVFWLMSD